ncbi:MAG TPA: hypothetical protein VNF74_00160 [Terriglobales bacterium]|nr:hypothetical protein [Terriglobales bacterium]
MKKWILPTLAVGGVVFLMTRPGRELQEQISDNFSDWVDGAIRSNHRLQQTLAQLQKVLERFNRTLEKVA